MDTTDVDPTGTEEARALREAVRDLLAKRSDSAAVREAMVSERGFDAELWSVLCEQIGAAALVIPEVYGGVGASMAEMYVVLEELGRALTPSPMLGSAVLAGQAILAAGDEDGCGRLLPGIADGSSIAALAWAGEDGRWAPDGPACSAKDSVVDGTACYVLDGDIADVLLVAARTSGGIGLFEVDPRAAGIRRWHTPAMDQTRRLATVEFTGVRARRLDTSGYANAMCRVRDLALLALSAEQVGAAERALELTVEYTSRRTQFGRPIGGFQALKHRMADTYVLTESARSTSQAALSAALDDDADPALEAAVAKVCCSEALQQAAAEMIQLHGGIAITWEHDAHLYFKRAHNSAHLFGTPQEYVHALSV